MGGFGFGERPDEGTPVHEDIGRNHPMVVFGDGGFCAGKSLSAGPMQRPHMHSQFEVNFVLKGWMTYWFDGREVTLTARRLALFWGMIPHQMMRSEPGAQFGVIYVPISVFLALPALSRLREAVFRGSVIEALVVNDFDADQFVRWRHELLSDDETAAGMARDEIVARIRRLAHEGWRDLRAVAPLAPVDAHPAADRLIPVEKMSRFIGEHCREQVSAKSVARASGLHPNYAMQLYKHAVGISIKQSIIHHRLDAAQSMLIATDRPIAFDCGFGSLSSFYETFDKRFGASPTEFRRLIRRGQGRACSAAESASASRPTGDFQTESASKMKPSR